MVHGKRQVVSFKTKKIRSNHPDDWIVVENTQELVITYKFVGRIKNDDTAELIA